ncbi:MAG: hypothetical protein ACLQU1_08540 [Bryobacteraceae bacterium]
MTMPAWGRIDAPLPGAAAGRTRLAVSARGAVGGGHAVAGRERTSRAAVPLDAFDAYSPTICDSGTESLVRGSKQVDGGRLRGLPRLLAGRFSRAPGGVA